MRTTIPQIFEEVEKTNGKDKKIAVLRSYHSPQLEGMLQINFNPDVKLDLPEGEPPFKKDEKIPIGYSETNLYAEFRRMYIWLEPNINLSKIKKEQLFVQMLEGIHWTESEVVCLAKDKKLETRYKTLTEDLVREAFPNILPPAKPKTIVDIIPVPKKEPKVKKAAVSLKD